MKKLNHSKIKIYMIIFLIVAYISLFMPLGILIIAKHNEYFVNVNGFKVTTGGCLAIVMVALAFSMGFKKLHKTIWATLLLAMVWFTQDILDHATPIIFCFWLGVVLFSIFEIPYSYFKKRFNNYVDQMDREEAKEVYAEERKKINGGI